MLHDGTRINPETGEVLHDVRQALTPYVELPTDSEATRIVTRARLSIVDLPAPPEQMTAIGLVVLYTIYGLSDIDIAVATGLTVVQVDNIKMLDAFAEAYSICIAAALEQDTDDVRSLLQTASRGAARRVASMVNSENEAAAYAASRDVLDRTGHRPADIVEHRHRIDGDLRITHIKKDLSKVVPSVKVKSDAF